MKQGFTLLIHMYLLAKFQQFLNENKAHYLLLYTIYLKTDV